MSGSILVTGARGQVGWELQRTLAPLGDTVAIDIEEEYESRLFEDRPLISNGLFLPDTTEEIGSFSQEATPSTLSRSVPSVHDR